MTTVARQAEARPRSVFDADAMARQPRRRRDPASPTGRRGRPFGVDLAVTVVGLGLGITVGLALTDETASQLRAPGGGEIFLGSLTGLVGTYLALVMVLLVSRIPLVERVLGHDGLLRWHRRLAPWPLTLIAGHAVFLTLGYAQAAHTGALHQVATFLRSYPNMLSATVALGIMLGIGLISIRAIRRRLRRETWWAVHLAMYLALALSFGHQLALGPSFVAHPLTRAVWTAAWICTAGTVIVYRFGLPLFRSLRHRLEVVEVRQEAPGVASIILRGRHLDRLAVSGGQFFEWRFLARGMWWQAHPFSISARPHPPYLRLTVKAVGDYTAAIPKLRPGTRVAIEGPYGVFTVHARTATKVACIAGGIGVTAVRSLLEDLPRGTEPVVVLRASKEDDLALADEVAELVRQRKGRVHQLVGSRSVAGLERLLDLVPDLGERDVYVAGPEAFVESTVGLLRRLGVREEALHHEAYAL
jgi:predicted ferric reductase